MKTQIARLARRRNELFDLLPCGIRPADPPLTIDEETAGIMRGLDGFGIANVGDLLRQYIEVRHLPGRLATSLV